MHRFSYDTGRPNFAHKNCLFNIIVRQARSPVFVVLRVALLYDSSGPRFFRFQLFQQKQHTAMVAIVTLLIIHMEKDETSFLQTKICFGEQRTLIAHTTRNSTERDNFFLETDSTLSLRFVCCVPFLCTVVRCWSLLPSAWPFFVFIYSKQVYFIYMQDHC